MKKVFYFLLMMAILLPISAKADMVYKPSYYNKRPTVGGKLEINVPIVREVTKITYYYDSTMLKPADDITSFNMDNRVQNVIMGDGTLTLEVKYPDAFLDEYDEGYLITAVFVPIKEGTSTIKIKTDPISIVVKDVTYEAEALVSEKEEKPAESQTEEVPSKTPEETAETAETTGTKDIKKESFCQDTYMYILIGTNILLIITLLVVALKRNKKEVQ